MLESITYEFNKFWREVQKKEVEPNPEVKPHIETERKLLEIGNIAFFKRKLEAIGSKQVTERRAIIDERLSVNGISFEPIPLSDEFSKDPREFEVFKEALLLLGIEVSGPVQGMLTIKSTKKIENIEQYLIRVREDEKLGAFFAVKGPSKVSDKDKSRLEYEARLNSNALGLLRYFVGKCLNKNISKKSHVEKYRTSYELNLGKELGTAKIEIDEFPVQGIPAWAEVEGSHRVIEKVLGELWFLGKTSPKGQGALLREYAEFSKNNFNPDDIRIPRKEKRNEKNIPS